MKYPEIGEAIARVMKAHGVTNKELAEVHSERLGLSPVTLRGYIVNIRKGELYGCSNNGVHKRGYACRLAHILKSIGIEEGHSIVNQIREIDSEFRYPPVGGVSYEQLKAEIFRSSKSMQQLLVEHPGRLQSIIGLLVLEDKSYYAVEQVIQQFVALQERDGALEKKVEKIPITLVPASFSAA